MSIQITTTTSSFAKANADLLVCGLFQKQSKPVWAEAAADLEKHLGARVRTEKFEGAPGDALLLRGVTGLGAETVLIVGLGAPKDFTARRLRQCAGSALTKADKLKKRTAAIAAESFLPPSNANWARPEKVPSETLGRTLGVAIHEATYRFEKYKSDKTKHALKKVAVAIADKRGSAAIKRGVTAGEQIGQSISDAKDLMNTPSMDMAPKDFAAATKRLFKDIPYTQVRVLGVPELKRKGCRGILAVGQGSAFEPRLVEIRYRPREAKGKHFAFVGKGVTFDTGGISLKPSPNMHHMKYDMNGAGGVLGATLAVARQKLPVKVTTLIPLAHNMPDGKAQVPGDIIKAFDGQTVEVLNTDAEGRLILMDALGVAAKEHKPDFMIDMATLTGACVVALGDQCAGLMGVGSKLKPALNRLGERIGERCWELPLYDEYKEQLKSNIADLQHIGGRGAGTITAGMFLRQFIGDTKEWAHLDIAGVGWTESGPTWATGYGIYLLSQLVAEGV